MKQDQPAVAKLSAFPMMSVMAAQFFSAFGDNALLFATLALLKNQHYPDWTQPVLQMVFVAAYIILAPFVGQMADRFPKGRVMMVANALKLLGALAICSGANPFLGYGLVGIGAAAYSPAKYGILGELAHHQQLVKANSMMETSTIAAILLGSLSGGILADWNMQVVLSVCVLAYGLAVLANVFIPRLRPALVANNCQLRQMLPDFIRSCQVLWRNSDSQFSLLGTSLFWGSGVTLRFLLVLWVPVALGISDNKTPTILNALVAVGVVGGAMLAAKWITLQNVQRCIPAGILLGVCVIGFSLQHSLAGTAVLMICCGALGGFFVVPQNALLQDRGRDLVGAGKAVAVQNLGENSAMLIMLGLFSLAIKLGAAVVSAGVIFGALFALVITFLWLLQYQQKK